MMKKRIVFLLLVLSVFAGAHGQKVASLEEYRSKYPGKQAVVLMKREEVRLTLGKNDSIDVKLNYHSEMLHLGERTEGLAESTVSFSDFVQITELDARTLVPNKSSYRQVKVTEFHVKNPSSGGIFYDDNKLKEFNYPGVQAGAKTVLTYAQKFREPRLLSPYYFGSYVPVIESQITLYVDKRLKIGYRLFNDKEGKIKFRESSEGNFTVYTWTAKDLQEFETESNAQNISYYVPHLIYFLEEINLKNKKEVVFKTTEDLYRWYYSMSIKGQRPVDSELRSIIDSLTRGTSSEFIKAQRIYYWVQDHVKYVAFEEGYGGFIPRDANLVCERRYGDCKDMANLLVQMLTTAGLKAYHTWIGTRDIPYSYSELPATNVDNHMIAAVKIDGKYIFLDATGKYSKLGIPTSMIQGKEALIGIDEHHFEVVKVPVVAASENKSVDSVRCYISGNFLMGKGVISLSGYNKIDFTYMYNYTKKDNRKEFIQGYSTKGSNKFILKDYTIGNLDEKDKSVRISYDFELEDYIKSSGNELYINLNLDRTHDKSKIDTAKRKLPFEYDYQYTEEDVITLDVPEGYKVDYLPENVKLTNAYFQFEITYRFDEKAKKIIYRKTSTLSTLLLEKKDFPEWNKLAAGISQAYREVLVLKKK